MAIAIRVHILLPCIVILSMLVVSSSTRIFRGIPTTMTRDSARLMSQIAFDVQRLNDYRRRATVLDVGTTARVAPEGPDPQHHWVSPGLP